MFAKPLDQALKDANNQIKATRDYFRLQDAKGLFILADDGNFAMYPDFAVCVLRNRLNSRYGAIQSFIYFAPGMQVDVVHKLN